MKKKGLKKLSLEKVKIAQLNNPQTIIGGSFPTATEIPLPTTKDYPSGTLTSTKTLPVGNTGNCM